MEEDIRIITNPYDYFVIRKLCTVRKKNDIKLRYVSDTYQTYDDAKKVFDSFVLSDDFPQIEFIKAEHNKEGLLICDNSLAIRCK